MDQFKFEEVEQSWGSDNRGSNVSSSSGNSGSSGGISAGAFARFNSSDIPSDDDLDIEYESRPRFNDPQKMNPHKVRVLHFRPAYLYDTDAPVGFQVQRWVAKKKYSNYKQQIRSREGWKNYRRLPHIVYEEVREGNRIFMIKRTINMKVPGSRLPDFTVEKVTRVPKGATLIRLPKEDPRKDQNVDAVFIDPLEADDKTNVSPKMFTLHMGREVARLRNDLGLTQTELAMIVNVDTNYIKNVELGELISFNPEDVIVRKLAKALGVQAIKYHE